MKKITSFLTSEEFIIIFLSLILLLGSYGPLAWQFLNPPPGKVFLGTLGYPDDFWGNFMSFQEGRLGHWQHLMKFTSTFRPMPTFLKTEYILLGQLSRLFPINQLVFFHLARFFISMAIIAAGYLLIAQVFRTKRQRLAAFLLAFFSTSIDPKNTLVNLWTPLTVFLRVAYHPHYLFSFLFLILALIFLGRALEQKRISTLLIASFWGFLAAQIHSPTIFCLYLTFPFYLIFIFIRQAKFNFKNPVFLKKLVFLILFTLISCLPLIYLYRVSLSPPWNILSKLDLLFDFKPHLTVTGFFLGIGPTALLALIGAVLAIKSGKDWPMLLAPWSIVYLLGFYFIWKIIGYNSARFLQTPFFIILGILSAYSLDALVNWLQKKRYLRKENFFLWVLVLLILAFSFPAYKHSLKENLVNFTNAYSYINSPNEVLAAFNWLAQNSGEEDIVLASPSYGNIIAALSGNWPFITTYAWGFGHYSSLENVFVLFFGQNWPDEATARLVKQEKIKFVFYGPEEKLVGLGRELKYSFLKKVFENSEVTIYQVST